MRNSQHLTVERMVGFTQFDAVELNASGTALLIAFQRSANASPLAFLALSPEEATEHAADILRAVLVINNGASPEFAVTLPGLVVWHPFGNPPDTDRLVLITNEDWPDSEKTWVGWFDKGCWYESSGSWLDADPTSGDATMPPTHWAEMPRRRATSTRKP